MLTPKRVQLMRPVPLTILKLLSINQFELLHFLSQTIHRHLMSLSPGPCRFKSNACKTHSLRNNNKELSETERVSERQWTWKRRARREISHQTAGPDPGDECSADGRIILHNKCFKFKPVIDSWSQGMMCSHHTWVFGSCQSNAATGGGIMIVIWQLPDLM